MFKFGKEKAAPRLKKRAERVPKVQKQEKRHSKSKEKVKKAAEHIGNKINLIFSFSLIVVIAVVVGFVSVFNLNMLERDFLESCSYNINAIITMKEQKVENTYNAVSELASSLPLASALSSNGPYGYMQALAPHRKGGKLAVLIVGSSGQEVYSTGEDISTVIQKGYVGEALDGTEGSFVDVINEKGVYVVSAVPVYQGSKIVGAIISAEALADEAALDTLKMSSGADYTVFFDATRTATTVTAADGTRQVNTQMSPIVYEVIKVEAKRFTGKASVLGQSYMVNYDPLVDWQGNVVGALFSGRRLDGIVRQNMSITLSAALIGLLLYIITNIFLILFVRRNIEKPLKRIVEMSGEMAQGNLGLKKPLDETYAYTPNDEIGRVFYAQLETIYALRSYISEIDTVLSDLADGKLTTQIVQDYKGDFTNIKNALMQVQTKLIDSMTRINQAASILTSSAGEIASSSQALAQGATEQAGSVEELNATIDEVYHNVKNTAENARNASSKTMLVGQEVAQGDKRVREMILAMTEINEASSKIEKIIKTIEDIAFQTNILALNAAVEAARAGAAGKGFAVVADEVRNLAGKSAQAARDTTQLIQNSLKVVSAGSEKADETAAVMMRVVSSVNEVVGNIEGISRANEEQAVALGQIQGGMTQIAAVVGTTSATAEESAATAEELSAQAKLLENLVETFQLN